ncbi:hypothetical protein DFH07DRAFT_39480 [Mycena maculata]|uniref:Uncharacterized protein n=1 Tax=Mycena maculata TaxID=230809 RepID=A0AAD7IJ75_9AGAR|nr:hypothetical protein DFH07DRAFT_39480 [Mycena maculata]
MMLLQKQPHFSMALAQSPYIHTHRRHPSAPPQAVVVQPTRTPGLLSLSRPPRARNDHKVSPKPRQAQQAQPASREGTPAPLKPAPEIRGRQQGKKQQQHQQQQQRSSSQAAPSRRRQPSPDPFRAAPAAPNKRRQLPIPVPPKLAPANPTLLSRSDPVLSHMHMPRRKPQRATTLDSDVFPICDDMTEAGSRPSSPESHSHSPRPITPTRTRPDLHLAEPRTPTRRTRVPEGPRTAPLSSASAAPASFFPFPTTSTPNSSPKRRPAAAARRAKHLSEGVFPPEDPEMQAFIHALSKRSRSTDRSTDDPAIPDGYFASSMFQNSPSPEELPPPLFA